MSEISYVSADIIGGLGNHLFIIAMLLSYVKKTKKKLVFKYEEDLWNGHNLPRKTFWNTLFKGRFETIRPEYFNLIKFNTYVEEKNHTYKNLPLNDNNVFFKGYYQSFKYIDDSIRKKMIENVYSNEELMTSAYDMYNKIKTYFGKETEDDDMVSVHIRRTDYILSSNYHNNLTDDYYKKALEIVKRKYIVIFSDDIEWCKNSINKSWYDYENIFFVDIQNVEVEFILMSMFQHNIIANSTYSLWASFISTYQKPKIIVAPQKWFADEINIDCKEVFHKYITNII